MTDPDDGDRLSLRNFGFNSTMMRLIARDYFDEYMCNYIVVSIYITATYGLTLHNGLEPLLHEDMCILSYIARVTGRSQ
jgi:hypothetical protein